MRIVPGQQLLFCPIGGGMSDSIYTGSSADDHSGGSDAGVAYGRDPSGGEMAYQFGNLWVSARRLMCLSLDVCWVSPRACRCCLCLGHLGSLAKLHLQSEAVACADLA